jgi:arylsulfatase A-like enzyme
LFRKNASDAFGFLASCGWVMVVWDTVALVQARQANLTWDFFSVLMASAALTMAHVLVVGAVVAPMYAFALGDQRIATRLKNAIIAVSAALKTRSAPSAVSVHACLLAAPAALLGYVFVAVPLAMRVHEDVRVAINAAGASIVIHLLAVFAGALLFAVLRGVWMSLLRPLASRRLTQIWLMRPWLTAAFLSLFALFAMVWAVVMGRRVLSALDLRMLWIGLTVMVLGAILATVRTIPRLSKTTRRVIGWSAIIGEVIFTLAATFAVPYSSHARSMLVAHTTFGTVFHASHNTLFDWDGDGYTTLFGGNDCAPFDPTIHPGAVDIPYNGIDEDCSGEDFVFDVAPPLRRWDYPVPDRSKKPHIVLLTIDALNPLHLGFNGYDRPTSPHLDAFAKHAVRFENAFAQGPSTRLSIPSLFTSLYDPQIKRAKLGRIPLAVLSENVTVAEILQKEGYRTIAVVPSPYFTGWGGITQGFQEVDGSAAKLKQAHTSKEVSDAVIERLESVSEQGQPVFLWAHYFDPHGPFDQPPDAPVFGTKAMDVYDAEIRFTDEHLGRVLSWIEEHWAEQDRLLVVTADHGESFDDQHAVKHHGYDLNTSVLRIPMLIHMPIFAPHSVRTPVSLLDMAPTFINLAQAKGEFDFQGSSLVPMLQGEEMAERVTFHTFFLPEFVKKQKDPLRMVSVRTDRFNLVHDREKGVYSLFDFVQDQNETNNLFDADRATADHLMAQMQYWYYRVLDQGGSKENAGAATATPRPPIVR